MANGTVFDQALEISTPGFNSLLQTIQGETQRIERNRELARQRRDKLRFTEIEDAMALSQQLAVMKEQQEDAVERMNLQNKMAYQQAEQQHSRDLAKLDYEYSLMQDKAEQERAQETVDELYEGYVDADKDSIKLQESLHDDFSNVFQNGLLPEPQVKPELHSSGEFYINTVQSIDGEKAWRYQTFRNIANNLQPLAKFMDTLRDSSALVESQDGGNIMRVNKDGLETTYITRQNAQEYIKRINNMTPEEQVEFAQRVQEGQLDAAKISQFADADEAIGKKDDRNPYNLEAMRSVRKQFVNIKSQGGIITLPPDFSRQEGNPINFDLKGKNMQDLRNLKDKFLSYGIDQELLVEDEDNPGRYVLADDIDKERKKQYEESFGFIRDLIDVQNTFMQTKEKFPGAEHRDFKINWDWDVNADPQGLWNVTKSKERGFEKETNKDYDVVKNLTGNSLENLFDN